MWYYYDTEQIKYRRSPLLNICVIGIGVIAIPYYFFRSRGFRKGLLYTALLLTFVIAWLGLQMAGASAVYYGIQS